MKKIQAIIVEDQDLDKVLKPIISKFVGQISVIGTAKTLNSAFDLIIEKQDEIDLIFLDYFLDKSESEAVSAPVLIDNIKSKLGEFPFPIVMVTNFAKKAREIAKKPKYRSNIIGMIVKDYYLGLQFEEQLNNLISSIIQYPELIKDHLPPKNL